VTLVTVLSIVAVVSVYAVLIGTFPGGDVTVGGMGSANVMYSTVNADPGSWTSTLSSSGTGVAWYSRLEIVAGGYSGPVKITWQLENKTGASTWTNVTGASALTTMVLDGSAQNVYVTSDGTFGTGNYDWGANSLWAGTYRVMAYVESA
jgi:hypothetical protein